MPRRPRPKARSGYSWRFSTRDRKGRPVDLTSEERRGEMYDDVVLDDWFHMEWMSRHRGVDSWWMRLGDASITVQARGPDARTLSIQRGVYGRILPDPMPPGRVSKALPKPFVHKAAKVPRRRLMDWELEIGRIVGRMLAGRMGRKLGVRKLLDHFGRGARTVAVDWKRGARWHERLSEIERELACLGYTTELVDVGADGKHARWCMQGKIIVTQRGGLLLRELDKLGSGLIWIRSKIAPRDVAMKIHEVLRTTDFSRDRCQAVEV